MTGNVARRVAASPLASSKQRVLDELRRDYNPGLGKFPRHIAQAVGLSEPYTRKLLSELVREKQARKSGSYEVCYQWRPPPTEGPITALESARLALQAAENDHDTLMESAGQLLRGGHLEGAHQELDHANDAYQRVLRCHARVAELTAATLTAEASR